MDKNIMVLILVAIVSFFLGAIYGVVHFADKLKEAMKAERAKYQL